MNKDFELSECNLNENEDIEPIIFGNTEFYLNGESSSLDFWANIADKRHSNNIYIRNQSSDYSPDYYSVNTYGEQGDFGCEDMNLQDLMNFHEALGLFIKYELKRNNLQQQGQTNAKLL